ncbi:MAG: alpha/beta hydrolase [Spirochaetaceae bacterium]|nr:MAG: alpha/beta hydrolase [Spirochaetaceae bacterium]
MLLKNDVGTVYYEVHGPENAPAVVFSHGVAMDHRTFEPQIAALSDTYRVIVWDMPFHGDSTPIDESLAFSPTAAEFIVAILDELGIHKAVAVGVSLGTTVGQHLMAKYPDRVTAAVQISGASLYPNYPAITKALIPIVSIMMKPYPMAFLKKKFGEHKALTQHTKEYLGETIERTGKKAVTHLINDMIRDLATGLPAPPPHPTLIMYGDHDMRFIRKMSEKWHERLPETQLQLIENAHHILNQDNPDACNAALRRFLAEVTAA